MIETIETTLYFIAAIVVLIGFHEYGHFIVARKLGIKVEKFSIGFGPSLFSWRGKDGEVEYVIAAIPLGGYVKMLGENPYEQLEEAEDRIVLSEADKKRAFNRQPVWKRAAVAFAGPGFNFVFAIFAFALAGIMGQEVLPATIGTVAPNSVAAEKGIVSGDKIIALNNQAVFSWQNFEEYLKLSANEEVHLKLERAGEVRDVYLSLPQSDQDIFLIDVADKLLGVGLGMDILIEHVSPQSPAEAALLESGDQVIGIDGNPVKNIRMLIQTVSDHAGKPVRLQVLRGQSQLQLQVIPEANEAGRGLIGVRLAAKPWEEKIWQHKGFIESTLYGFSRTWEVTVITVETFKRLLSSSISADNLGGPIAIAQMAGSTASNGLVYFVMFLAFFSVNLAILNLLPVPVLDGGMLMFLALEQLRGKPLSADAQMRFQMVGMLLIMSLMVFAFYNDIMRLF